MPNYLLQWSAIKWAKENGYRMYDFWGISENNSKWQGITRFKKGFVSEKTEIKNTESKSFDMVINNFCYIFLSIVKKIKR